MKRIQKPFALCLLFVLIVCCAGKGAQPPAAAGTLNTRSPDNAAFPDDAAKLKRVLANAGIPAAIQQKILASGDFMAALAGILGEQDRYLRLLVDKQHPLGADYEPDDLVLLQYKSYRAGITDPMMLRRKVETALEAMAADAKTAGITLVVSSAYRSYEYQLGSFERWTARLGLKEAERVSARAGYSQHQLGLVVDFGSINNSFAETAAGRWVAANAARYGFSLSYPQGREDLTGYAWESWHYRYVGTELAGFINLWFDNIQQYALRFLFEWEKD